MTTQSRAQAVATLRQQVLEFGNAWLSNAMTARLQVAPIAQVLDGLRHIASHGEGVEMRLDAQRILGAWEAQNK